MNTSRENFYYFKRTVYIWTSIYQPQIQLLPANSVAAGGATASALLVTSWPTHRMGPDRGQLPRAGLAAASSPSPRLQHEQDVSQVPEEEVSCH